MAGRRVCYVDQSVYRSRVDCGRLHLEKNKRVEWISYISREILKSRNRYKSGSSWSK